MVIISNPWSTHMPVYEFKCKECGTVTGELRKIGDFSPAVCSHARRTTQKNFLPFRGSTSGSGCQAVPHRVQEDEARAGEVPCGPFIHFSAPTFVLTSATRRCSITTINKSFPTHITI